MNKDEMKEAIKKLAFEMTASLSTAIFCMEEMDLDSESQLREIAEYIEFLVDSDV